MVRVLSTPHLAEGKTLPRGTLIHIVEGSKETVSVINELNGGEHMKDEIIPGSLKKTPRVPDHLLENLHPSERERWKDRLFLLTWSPKSHMDIHAVGYRELPVTGERITQVRASVAVIPRVKI